MTTALQSVIPCTSVFVALAGLCVTARPAQGTLVDGIIQKEKQIIESRRAILSGRVVLGIQSRKYSCVRFQD